MALRERRTSLAVFVIPLCSATSFAFACAPVMVSCTLPEMVFSGPTTRDPIWESRDWRYERKRVEMPCLAANGAFQLMGCDVVIETIRTVNVNCALQHRVGKCVSASEVFGGDWYDPSPSAHISPPITTTLTPSPRLVTLIERHATLWVRLVMDVRYVGMHALARHIQMGAIEGSTTEHQCCLGG